MNIDPEFAAMVPPLTPEEHQQLEDNLQRDGCRDPLVTWNGILLDGHNRYEVCTRLQIPYRTIEVQLPDRDAAKVWILQNQLGRRNLQPFQRAELALQLEPLIAKQARAKQQKAGGAVPKKSAEAPIETRQAVAKVAGLSHNSVAKAKRILETAPEDVKTTLRAGKTTINREYQKIKAPAATVPPVGRAHVGRTEAPPAVNASEPDGHGDGCDVPGCQARGVTKVDRCAVHVDRPTLSVGPKDSWDEYKRHIEALKQLLPRIPNNRVDAAQNAVFKLFEHAATTGPHKAIFADALLQVRSASGKQPVKF